MLTFFTQLFWQKYIQLTHGNLQRSLSISTASYIVGINPADQNANQIQCLDQQRVAGYLHQLEIDLCSDACLASFAEA
ncbi:hypothetical protein [Nostoc sp.]